MQPIKGLFTIYFNDEKNSALLEITPDQLNKVYLCNMTRQSGDGMMFDASSMLGEFPFYFQKIGERIQMIQKNIIERCIILDKTFLLTPIIETGSRKWYTAKNFIRSISAVGNILD